MKDTNRIFLTICSIVFLCGCMGGQTTNTAFDTTDNLPHLRYGGQYYPDDFLLKGKDFWEPQGITVTHTIFSSGSENNEALISGSIDINVGSDSKTAALFSRIPDKALVIGTVQRGNRYTTMVRPDSGYRSWEDLKGKKVATRFGTGAEAVLRKYYLQNGLAWEDFDYVNLKVEDMPMALENGQIEAFTAWAVTPEIAEANGVGKPLMSYGDIALAPVSIHTTKEFAEKNPDLLIRFLASELDKAEFINEHPEKAAHLAADASKERGIVVPSDAFEKAFQRIDFSIELNEEIIQAIDETAAFLVDQGKLQEAPVIVYDDQYLVAAREMRAYGNN